jgi:hypothetical protein
VLNDDFSFRKHLLSDLAPYSCIYASCMFAQTPFPNRKAWIDHLLLGHSNADICESKNCLLCREPLNVEKYALLTHILKHLEEISLSALPLYLDSEKLSENGDKEGDEDDNGIFQGSPKPMQVEDLHSESSSSHSVPGDDSDDATYVKAVWKQASELSQLNNDSPTRNDLTKPLDGSSAVESTPVIDLTTSGDSKANEAVDKPSDERPDSSDINKPNYRWWVPAEGIGRHVIQDEIRRYLGPDALVKPGQGMGENMVCPSIEN